MFTITNEIRDKFIFIGRNALILGCIGVFNSVLIMIFFVSAFNQKMTGGIYSIGLLPLPIPLLKLYFSLPFMVIFFLFPSSLLAWSGFRIFHSAYNDQILKFSEGLRFFWLHFLVTLITNLIFLFGILGTMLFAVLKSFGVIH